MMRTRRANRIFTDEEKQYILKNHSVMMVKDIATNLSVSRNKVSSFKKLVGLPVDTKRKFTEEEIKFMTDHKKRGYRFVSAALNRSINSVSQFYLYSRLTKPKAKAKLIDPIDISSLKEELNSLISFTYQGSMFNSAYERVKQLNYIISHG